MRDFLLSSSPGFSVLVDSFLLCFYVPTHRSSSKSKGVRHSQVRSDDLIDSRSDPESDLGATLMAQR